GSFWLQYQSPGCFRLAVDAAPEARANGTLTTEQGIPIALEPQDLAGIQGGAAGGGLREVDLALRAAQLGAHRGFERSIAAPLVRDGAALDHQIRTVKTVLRRLRGRALLCDEVGLGKTIEAGLILSELLMRGLARSVLVLVPPSLIEQWQGEMRRKFSIELI